MQVMNNFTFGITMILVGMGGTLFTLWFITLLITVMKKLFPADSSEQS